MIHAGVNITLPMYLADDTTWYVWTAFCLEMGGGISYSEMSPSKQAYNSTLLLDIR